MYRKIIRFVPWVLLIVIVILLIYGFRAGLFTSAEELQAFLLQFGAAAGLVFLLVQVVQVVIPIIPGGASSTVGVLLFGAVQGFFLNYAGMCIGSVIAFYLSQRYGRRLLCAMFDDALIEKYESWTSANHRFTKLFAIAIVIPFMPDDFLCYLAGTTAMPWKHFIPIVFLGRIPSLLGYSIGLKAITQLLQAIF